MDHLDDSMTTAPVQEVSETALMVAVLRARENERSSPLYRDPLALKLAGTRGAEIVSGLPKIAVVASTWMISVRTRVIDDMICDAIRAGVDTVINLGAGLDTRPYRLDLPKSLRWVEIDYPNIINIKALHLADEKPVCDLKRMPCDMTDPVALRALLSEVAQDTKSVLIVTEGVIPYLSNEQVGELAQALRSFSNVRFWIADYSSPLVRKGRERAMRKGRMQNAKFRFEPKDYFSFFSSRGWRATKVCWTFEEAQRLGRNPPGFMRALMAIRRMLMRSERWEQVRRFMGHVLFEPTESVI